MKRLATLLSVLLLAMAWTMINADEAHAQDSVEIFNEGLRQGPLPGGWAIEGQGNFETGAGGYFRINGGGSALRTHVLDLSGYTALTLNYSTRHYGGASRLEVEVSFDGGDNWEVDSIDGVDLTGNNYDDRTVSLGDNWGPSVMIRFRVATGSGARLRDVVLTGIPPGDLPPQVAFGAASGTAVEGQPVEIPVTLTNFGSTNVNVDIVLTTGEATEFSPPYTTTTLTFSEGGTQNLPLTLVDDGIWTGVDRVVIFTLDNETGDPDAQIGTQNTFTLTITDSSPPPAPEGVLVRYEFTGNSPVPTEAHSDVTASDFGISSGNVNYASFQSGDWDQGSGVPYAYSTVWNATSQSEAKYWEFEVTPETGKLLVVDQIDFAYRRQNTNGPATFGVSINDNVVVEGISIATTATTYYGEFPFEEITILEPTTIKIQAWDGGNGEFRIDDVTLRGTVEELPEGSVAITGSGAGWRMLSSIGDVATVQDLANVNLVYGIPGEYQSVTGTNPLIGYDGAEFMEPSGLSHALTPGKGFIWYLWDTEEEEGATPNTNSTGTSSNTHLPFVLTYTGSPVVENHQVTFLHSERAETDDGFYLIGNPYASGYAVSGINAGTHHDDLGTTFSYHDPAINNYVELSDEQFNGVAPVGAGFFAQFMEEQVPDENVTFTFGPPVAERTDAEVLFARFQLSGELVVPYEGTDFTFDILDRSARAVFSDLATDGRDRYDATKLNPLTEYWAGIAMIGVQGEETIRRAAESRPMPLEAITLPMALTTHTVGDLEAGGTFTIELVTDALGSGWEVSLRDLETGQTVNMLADSYTFTLPVQPAIAADERFELTFTPPTVSGDDGGESLAFGLEALWPNPTHGTTRVAFTLPQAQDITLDVFDVLGRRVMQIANDEYGSGRHVLPMSTSALASGVYVVRLTAGSQTAVQRVTVAR